MKKICCFVLSLALLFMNGCSYREFIDRDYYIFKDISECEKIVENKSDDAVVTVMESPDGDKYLKDLSYDAFWGCEYEAEELDFTLYAYVFSDHTAACRYFQKITGKRDDRDKNYSFSWQMGSPRTILLSDNRVCVVYTSHEHETATYDYLNAIFTEEVKPS